MAGSERDLKMTSQAKQILLVDDEVKLLKSIAQRLKVLGFEPFTATSGMAAIEIAMKHRIDMAIVDLQMPDMNGLVTITKLKEIKPGIKTVLLTGHGNDKVKQATESLNTLYFEKDEMGDFWRFIKKISADGKIVVVHPPAAIPHIPSGENTPPETPPAETMEISAPRQITDNSDAWDQHAQNQTHFSQSSRLRIVGETLAMQELRKNIERLAPLNCTVALYGEAGSGKELVAKTIHAQSMRRTRRFLAIDCDNFNSEQLAGQLLGHSGLNLAEAIQTGSGIFSNGPVGTLFFDHIEKIPGYMQDQVSNILDMADKQKSIFPDIRILVATDADLARHVGTGSFRKDLYDRLNLFSLTIPPLRDRKDDIPLLSRYFFDKYRREIGKPIDSISPEVMKILVDYDFPRNVRELAGIIERAIILADGKIMEPRHLPRRFLETRPPAQRPAGKSFLTIAELEKRYIVEVLEATGGNKSKTAEILGISRAALWRKLKQLKDEQHPQ